MKPVRLLLIILGVLALLGIAVVALAFVPAVQRWAVLRAAASRPDLHLRFDSLAVRPSSFSARGLSFERKGIRIRFERLDADYSLFRYVWDSELKVDRLEASGVTVDATHVSRNRFLAGAMAAPAVLVQENLPLALVLGDLRIEGHALLSSSPGRPPLKGDFKISGGQLAPGHEGTLHFAARLVDPLPGAHVATLAMQAGLQLKQSPARSFDRVDVTALIDAAGPRISGQRQLKVAADLTRAAAGENYLLHVDTLSDGRSDEVLAIDARRSNRGGDFSGDWALTARSTQIEPFILGGPLPKFDARGSGSFALNFRDRKLALNGALQAAVSELETVKPALRALGTVQLTSDFDVAADGVGIKLNKLDLSLAGALPVLALHASGAAAFDLQARRFEISAPTSGALGAAPSGEILRLKLAGLPVAWIRPFIAIADVSGGAVTGEIAVASGEGRRLLVRTISPVRAGDLTVVRAGRTLLRGAEIGIDAEAELLPTTMKVRLRSLRLVTPSGDLLAVHGVVAKSTEAGEPVTVTGDFSADLPGLGTRWLASGHLRAHGAADCTIRPGRIDFRSLNFEADNDKGARVVGAAISQAFGFDLAQLRADTGPAEVELARIGIGRLPLGFFVRPQAGYTVGGTTAPDEFVLTALGDRLTLKSVAPLLLTDVKLARGSRPLLDGVSVEFSPALELAGGLVNRVASGDAIVRDSSGAPLASLKAELGQGGGTGPHAQLTFNLDLPGLVTEPMFARAGALSAGQASGDIRGAALGDGGIQIEARATLNGLVTRDGAKTLPVANLSFRGLLQSDGRFSVQAPVLLDSAGLRSDLNLAAEGTTAGGVCSFDAKLTGGHVELGDVLVLASAAGESFGSGGAESSGAESRELSPPAADEEPFWQGFSGQVAFDCKEVAASREWVFNGVTGRMAVGPDQLELQSFAADCGSGSKVAAQGRLAFGSGLDPYQISGEFSLVGFESSRFFRAVDPECIPTIEGSCDLRGVLEGRGLTLDDTLDRVRSQLELTSRNGVFRGLKRPGEKLSLASKAVRWCAALGALLKTGRVKAAAEKVVGSSYYVDQLAQALAEFDYDGLKLKMVRDESPDLKITDFSLSSSDVRLLGSGEVQYEPGKPLLEQPLSLTLNLSGRGSIDQILGKLHALDGTHDPLDFARAREPVVIKGTLARPDPVAYYEALPSGKAGD